MSRLYRKTEVGTWVDRGVQSLSAPPPNGQTLWWYLLTGQRTTIIPGVVVAREAVMADDLRWPLKGFRDAFEEIRDKGMAVADWDAGIVYLPKALLDSAGEPRELHRPQSLNVVKSWAKAWRELPECDLRTKILGDLETFCEAISEGFALAFDEAFAKARPKASSIQDQDAGAVTGSPPNSPPLGGSDLGFDSASLPAVKRTKAKAKSGLTPDELEIAQRVLGKITERTGVGYGRDKNHLALIAARLRDGVSERDLRAVIAYCWDESGLGWRSKTIGESGEAMAQYLRPETLFGPKKISQYLPPARAWLEKHFPSAKPDATGGGES